MADPTDADIAAMSSGDRVAAMLNAVLPKVPGDAAAQIRQLLTPQALHVIEGVIVLWGISHFFGFGEVFDALVLATGVAALGADAVTAAKLAMEAFMDTRSARTTAAIDAAADKLARAIAVVGIDMLATLLFRWKRPNLPNPARIADFPRAPAIPGGGWRYQPMVRKFPFPLSWGEDAKAYGFTGHYGDIMINTRYSLEEQRITLFHEQFHALMKPKIDILRRLRAKWNIASYKNSYLTRYLEEALCETSAQLRAKGFSFGNIVEGMKFPFNPSYEITITKMLQETGELFLGPIKVDNDIYYAALTKVGQKLPGGTAQVGLPGPPSQNFGDAFDARRMAMAGQR